MRLRAVAAAEEQRALKAQINKMSQDLTKAQRDTDKRLQSIQNQKQKLTADVVDGLLYKDASGAAAHSQYVTVSTPEGGWGHINMLSRAHISSLNRMPNDVS